MDFMQKLACSIEGCKGEDKTPSSKKYPPGVGTFYSEDHVKILERKVGRRKIAIAILADVIKLSNLLFEREKN